AIRNRGLFVIDMTAEDIRDMYIAREAIERAAARDIVVSGDFVAAGDALLAVVDKMGRAASAAEMSELDIEFHELLVSLSGSKHLRRMHQTVITETRMCIHSLDDSYAKSDFREEEHRTLATAVRSGDPELTDRLMVAHMDDALARLLEAPAEEPVEAVVS
ncbi:MAG: GntR family transcriptional regulator, partial [Mycobacterium sp.]|nr:GntR family transcriptional regulator [Mycobacterium sp.]